ncbi:hypothetical protein [Nocardioides sp.]|uniref:hypothetical protein n=1 Tax=Nocardioides sp. TaxID=35761 RepID=UPI003D0FF1FF
MQSVARRWPLYGVLGVSGVGLVAAIFRAPLVSTVAYAVLLLIGCGLLFYRRFDAIATTRSAGGSGVLSVQPVEKGAIAALSLACLVNGVVIAMEVARWPVWTQLREQFL